MNEELKAMRAIATALASLSSDAARQRVLMWVIDYHASQAEGMVLPTLRAEFERQGD